MPNRLAASTSPYLRQHADNPVDWFEWGDDAFASAGDRDVPILLSVGYSACHWCHVMAHESFEDPETAAVMNQLFVNVKVDREERPDVDAVYMEAVQAATGAGGWPMTVWITPDGRPFYAGTYFPREDRHGMPSFHRVMAAVSDAWRHRREDVLDQAGTLTTAISRSLPVSTDVPGPEALEAAYRKLAGSFDPVNGGFGGAPKFPQQPVLDFLLRISHEEWAPNAAHMVATTLTKMAHGGIYDQVGGGFARYAVDSIWQIPHFEKMLYDNAQLARLYLWAWRELGIEEFRVIAEEVIDYVRRDLRHPDGGFFSAEDADSEGEEGRFYVWQESEFRQVVGRRDAPLVAAVFGVTTKGNFEGSNTLHIARTTAEVAAEWELDPAQVATVVARARQRLQARRLERVRPGLDHKVVAAWNGLMLRALAEAGASLEREDLLDDARACARFLLERMTTDHGRLLRSWSEGEAKVAGFLEDHAAVALGLCTLYGATGEPEWYEAAARLTELLPRLFADPDGGFFTTAHDAAALVKRPKDQMDNPLPSGNSMAAEALLWLSLYTGDTAWLAEAESVVRAGAGLMERYPSAVGHLASVLHSMRRGTREVAVVGREAAALARPVWERYRPHVVVAMAPERSDLMPLLLDRPAGDGAALAYVCRGFVCDLPTSDPGEVRAALSTGDRVTTSPPP